MRITSAGTFTLDETFVEVPDLHITESSIIIAMLQAASRGAQGSWDGHYGIVRRVPGESFTFGSARAGAGARYGYIIFEP
jgi:hypothetical protein